MNITVIGAGAWGTAMAISLASKNKVVLWGRNQAAMEEAQSKRENTAYLPGYPLPDSLSVTADFESAMRHLGDDGLLILATSVSGLRPSLEQCAKFPIKNVVWLCKGFEEGSSLLPHQVVKEVLGERIPAGALSGPSFAQEVAQGLPCALTIASQSAELRELVVSAAHSPSLRVYSSDDVVGVEVGGAVKNILAIATGVADGLGLGLNARAALMTRGLAEISRLCLALGGKMETLMGLTGVGDLILTCTGNLSRNRRVGLALAEGKSLDHIVQELGHVAEGVRCARAVRELAKQKGVEMPITDAVAGVLFEDIPTKTMIERLLSRNAKSESFS
ncbi:NAD(P)H-dependent glycerol-3-phosphate dehydrogenase [Undibacterium cyanobacteriorum]|uniref:Glycerol-3-phosphate dehydrogenase [NAD(P)+] n=1 Tax=Undibacterium cyanobacteriorum TaxID=3073561 RepID=A0ABY9RJZ6_9BURK|nr:NAD(P)H-dependent glycerol-3-phosphate dehydrogenase [Undibacterium sp. 20NA77.5]WMW80985.1 NAD(P)H-dependent glycerol-3-phosphate dehydrogenase [Undibacterium sp. 20NA77.5]